MDRKALKQKEIEAKKEGCGVVELGGSEKDRVEVRLIAPEVVEEGAMLRALRTLYKVGRKTIEDEARRKNRDGPIQGPRMGCS